MSDRLEEIVVRLIKTYDATAFDTWGEPITWVEAIEALQSYIDSKIIEARIDELNGVNEFWHGEEDIEDWIEQRIKALNHRKEKK